MLGKFISISVGVIVFTILAKAVEVNFASAVAAILITAMTAKSAEEYFG